MQKNNTFKESGLIFRFPADWQVIKYDEHRFYQYVSGSGLKGVDFIAIHEERLYLIEVKNYVHRIKKPGYDPMEKLLNTVKEQANSLLRKLEDSLQLLEIIRKYHHRKWWYRRIYLPYFYRSKVSSELSFWTRVSELKARPANIHFVLWMEFPRDYSDQRAVGIREYFERFLSENRSDYINSYVVHTKAPLAGIKVSYHKG